MHHGSFAPFPCLLVLLLILRWCTYIIYLAPGTYGTRLFSSIDTLFLYVGFCVHEILDSRKMSYSQYEQCEDIVIITRTRSCAVSGDGELEKEGRACFRLSSELRYDIASRFTVYYGTAAVRHDIIGRSNVTGRDSIDRSTAGAVGSAAAVHMGVRDGNTAAYWY